MITLKTGVPGACKTLTAVHELALLHLSYLKREGDFRPVYVHGIRDLSLPHFLLDDPTKWDQVPDGSLVIIDECQSAFPPRSPSQKIPDHVASLNTHRHRGIDLVLITQHPKLIDQGVRRLVGKHQHYRRVFGGTRSLCYEWDHCEDSLASLKTATKSFFSFPKDAFKYYKSAEVHTKQVFKFPVWLWLFPLVAVPLLALGGHRVFEAINGHSSAFPQSASSSYAVTPSTSSPSIPIPHSSASSPAESFIVGCIKIKARCECVNNFGESTPVDYAKCLSSSERSGLLVRYSLSTGPVTHSPDSEPHPSSGSEPHPSSGSVGPVGISTSYTPRNPVRDFSGAFSSIGTPSSPGYDHDGSVLAGMRR